MHHVYQLYRQGVLATEHKMLMRGKNNLFHYPNSFAFVLKFSYIRNDAMSMSSVLLICVITWTKINNFFMLSVRISS